MSKKYHVTYTLETIEHVMRIEVSDEDHVIRLGIDDYRLAALRYCCKNKKTIINTQNCIIYVWPEWQYDEVKRYSVSPYFHRTGMNWGLTEIK